MADNKEYEILVDGEDDIEIETDSVSYLPYDNKSISLNSNGEMQAIGLTNGTDVITYDKVREIIDKPPSQSFEFETLQDFTNWLNGEFKREDGRTVDDLQIGNDVYIVDTNTPDYWCKSITKPFTVENNFEPLETSIDKEMSSTSSNAVENKVIKKYVDNSIAEESEVTQKELIKQDEKITKNTTDITELQSQLDVTTDTVTEHTQQIETLSNDLTGVSAKVETKQDKLTAGTGITIDNNVISASADMSNYYTKEQIDNMLPFSVDARGE